ncbi:ankyrin repeat-containing domain protein [Ustulina deusta]|nr:ankyrin repeat-containing domain protein [Ustulina deusta]
MDPLSISASVAGLVTLAGSVFSLAAKYIKDVREAPKEAKDLLDEVKQFSVLLHQLSLVARELEITTMAGEEALQDSPNLQWHYVYDCQTILNRVQIGLRQATDDLKCSSTFTKIRSRLKWPFSSDDTKEMIQTIQRHKQTINVALSANSYSRLAICLSRQEAAAKCHEGINKRLGAIQYTVKEILEIDTKVFLNERRKRVLDFFTKFANPWHDFEMVQSLRHPLTGLWFTESDDFKEWRATPGSKLWVTGIPGAGKSVLAGLVIYECLKLSSADDRKATTYFFCTYRDKATHSARNVLSSLVSQLARQNEEAFQIVEKYYKELASQKPLAAEPSLQKLLTVFDTMVRMFDQVFVVVDGLDECETDEVVRSLSQLSFKKNSASISTLLLSRDVVHIRDQLESDFGHIEIEAHTEDIQLYVFTELEKRIESKQLRIRNPELKAEIVDRLVNGAKGMFRWVACQLDYLGELPSDRERRNALSKLPPTLPATYERILMKVEQSSKEVRRLVQKTLQLICASLCDVGYLQEALAIRDDSNTLTEEDMVDDYEIMLRCSSLIRKSSDGTKLEFSHFTVLEFLKGIDPTHATLCLYRVSYRRAENVLAQVCLRYLMLEDFEKEPRADMEYSQYIRNRTQTRPFYRHCAIRWVQCVRDLVNKKGTEVDAATTELIQTLFDRRKKAPFCQWIVDYLDSWALDEALYICWDGDMFQALRQLRFDFGRGQIDNGDAPRKPDREEKEAFVTFIAAVVRPDFTPLHMASVLGLRSLCDHLLRHGAKVNLQSRFGTPLHCALGGISVFLWGSTRASRPIVARVHPLRTPLAQNQTARLLLAAGASATPRLSTPFQQRTLMGTMHLSPMDFDTFALFPDLVRAGLIVEEEELGSMETRLKFMRIHNRIQHHSSIILALLKCLKGTDDNSDGPVKRLYSIVYECAQSEHLDLSDLTPENIRGELADSDTRLDILQSMIKNNDVIALEKVVGKNRHELFKNARFNVDGEEWTALHLACDSSSSGVLELLLEIGTDPEITTHRGTKPIHLSHPERDSGDSLRVLLQHHVSTTARSGGLSTIWHLAIENDDIMTLKLLISLASDKNEALQIVSGSGQTAICLALDKQNEDAVTLLLEHCPTASFWKSSMPLYRQAARLGSLEVVKKLLDMGIQPDDFDDELGSPLHDINLRASVPCVRVLVETFPHRYRQRKDGLTPFKSFLARAVEEDVEIQPQALGALLPAFEASQSEEMVEETVGTWPFFCSSVIKYTLKATREVGSIKQMLTHVIDAGVITCFEEKCKIPAFVLFATELDQISSVLLPEWLAMRQGQLWDLYDRELSLLDNWECLSCMLLELTSKTSFGDSAAKHLSVARLLSHAILHDDRDLVKRLLQNGVDLHQRVDSMSALEIACLPAVAISKATFRCLLSYAKADKLNEHNERLHGYTITHLVGIRSHFQERSLWKLRQILEAGADANAVSSDSWHESALRFHITGHLVTTAEVLLQFGADPWVTGLDGLNAALDAIAINNTSLLKTIAEHSTSRKLAAKWNQTWKDGRGGFSGGNAFHLAAMWGSTDSMQLYLDEEWLDDLESVDDNLQTPMHYAARYGQWSTIHFLHHHHGCDIDRAARDGKSPLHLAIEGEHLRAVKELLQLGAKMKVDAHGLSPIAYAYRTGNLELINALERQNKDDENLIFQPSRKGIIKMADAFYVALNSGDLDACETFVTQGLPIDSEMCKPWPVTPLMLALSEHMSSQVVEWLLGNGAKVSIAFEGPNMPKYATVLEAAIADQKYNHLLHTLLRRYLEEDGDFSRLKQTPLHVAVWKRNYEGLRVLLDELCQLSDKVKDVVNQKNDLFNGITALHWAAQLDSVDAAALLISNGANLELMDFDGFTPLHHAAGGGSIDVLKLLIKQGACTKPLALPGNPTALMLACSEDHVEVAKHLLRLERNIMENSLGGNIVDMALEVADESPRVKLCAKLLPRDDDLHRLDPYGKCAILDVMACSKHWILRHLLREYPLSLRTQDIKWSPPSVWMMLTSSRFSLTNITRGYRLIHRYLRREEPLKVSDSVAIGESSLLYLAASKGLIVAIDDLLSIGIDTEGEVCEGGTALTIAAAHGQLDVVKYLIRRGAKVFHESRGLRGSALVAAHGKKEVLQWLLVDRYTDQAKITNANPNEDEEDRQVREWTGAIQVRLSLKWEWKKRRTETMLEYAFRFQNIMIALRGKLVNPIY